MILLQALAGYGKTSLLASMGQEWDWYSSRTGVQHLAWFRLDGSENDPCVFLEGLVDAVRGISPGLGLPTLVALRAARDPAGQLSRLLASLAEELHQAGNIALVLDDFHLLTNQGLLASIEKVLLAPESGLHLVISSREPPPYYLGGFRAGRQMKELGPEDLRFTSGEVRELVLRRAGDLVSDQTVDAVYRETKGWPAYAALAALLASRAGDAVSAFRLGPTEYGHARLAGELVRTFSAERREAVLRSSLLPFLDAAACGHERVMGKANGILHFIQDSGLPATSPSEREAPLRYDALFRAALRQELKSTLPTEEYRELQREAASYCESRGEWDEAIVGFLAAGDPDSAARVVETAAELELEMGHAETVLRWIRSIPAPARRSHPGLVVDEAKLLLAKGQLEEAKALLVAAKSDLAARGDEEGEAERLGAWAVLMLNEARLEDALHAVLEGLDKVPKRDVPTAAELLLILSSIHETAGDLQPAYSAASEGLLVAEKAGRRHQSVEAMLQVARMAFLLGRPREGLAMSGRGIQRAHLLGSEPLALSALGGHAALAYLELGDLPGCSQSGQ